MSCKIFAAPNNKILCVMRKIVIIIALASGVMLAGCSSLFSSSLLGSSDLYRTDNRVMVATRLKAEAEARQAEAEAREAEWLARQAQADAERAEADYYASFSEPSYQTIVANDYESAYARRLYGFTSSSYRLPSSYYSLSYGRNVTYAMAYDPALYNIMVSGDQVWVEPKFITSMFGSWGATNVTFGIYSSPWNYGWRYHVDPFYYSCWGYPRYSWYDWNWTICYNPWHYDAYWSHYYYNHYYPHYHHHYHPGGHMPPPPPQYRPNNRPNHRPDNRPNHGYITTGSGASHGPIAGNLNGGRDTEGSRYTSPTSNRNYGSSTVTKPTDGNKRPGGGSTSTGVNSNSKYTISGTTSIGSASASSSSTSNRGSSTTVYRGTTTTGSSNFRQGGTTSRGTSTSTSTSTGVSKGTSTSASRGVSVGSGTSKSVGKSSSSSSSSRGTTTYRSNSSSSSRSSSSSSSSSYRSGSSSRGTTTVGSVGNRSVGSSSSSSSSSGGSYSGSSGGSRGGSTSSRR